MKTRFTDGAVLVSIDNQWYDLTEYKTRLLPVLFVRKIAQSKELYSELEQLDEAIENAIRLDISEGRIKSYV